MKKREDSFVGSPDGTKLGISQATIKGIRSSYKSLPKSQYFIMLPQGVDVNFVILLMFGNNKVISTKRIKKILEQLKPNDLEQLNKCFFFENQKISKINIADQVENCLPKLNKYLNIISSKPNFLDEKSLINLYEFYKNDFKIKSVKEQEYTLKIKKEPFQTLQNIYIIINKEDKIVLACFSTDQSQIQRKKLQIKQLPKQQKMLKKTDKKKANAVQQNLIEESDSSSQESEQIEEGTKGDKYFFFALILILALLALIVLFSSKDHFINFPNFKILQNQISYFQSIGIIEK